MAQTMAAVKQTNIYDFLGMDQDPIYKQIENMKKGDMIFLNNHITISLNHNGIYEFETRTQHEQAKELIDFYKKLIQLQ